MVDRQGPVEDAAGDLAAFGHFTKCRSLNQTSKPTIRKLIMEQAKIEPSQKNCAGFLIPGYVVRFEAGDKAGEEKITYEVVYQSKKLGTWRVEDAIAVQ